MMSHLETVRSEITIRRESREFCFLYFVFVHLLAKNCVEKCASRDYVSRQTSGVLEKRLYKCRQAVALMAAILDFPVKAKKKKLPKASCLLFVSLKIRKLFCFRFFRSLLLSGQSVKFGAHLSCHSEIRHLSEYRVIYVLDITLLEMKLALPQSKVIYYPVKQVKDIVLHRDSTKN